MDSLDDKLNQKANDNIKKDHSLRTTLGLPDKLKAILPVLSAVTSGEEINIERRQKRLLICSDCPKLSLVDGKIGCGVCGCRLQINDKSIINLINYEETEKYGCKHPDGSQWKKNNV
jgi:hypothetical protein